MNNPCVSIVMPIYNAEKFLNKSLESVLNQTLNNIEIICVNDGSTDNSLNIINYYAKNDKRIVIFNKKNSGYGNTMNIGIKLAKGEYIGILEPDDFIDCGMLEKLYIEAKKYNLDVIKSNYFNFKSKSNTNDFVEVLHNFNYDEILSAEHNEYICYMRPCIWSAIYKKKLLIENKIFFNETPGASYQDTAFAFKVWVNAKNVKFVKNAYLHYRIDNENSSIHSSGKIFSICDEFQSIQSYLNSNTNLRNKYSKILQLLKLDTYTWNLNRISNCYKDLFRDQIALDFIKADYEGFLDKSYFSDLQWNKLQRYIFEYKKSKLSYYNGREIVKILMYKIKNKIKKIILFSD